jgi:hypothetical protein
MTLCRMPLIVTHWLSRMVDLLLYFVLKFLSCSVIVILLNLAAFNKMTLMTTLRISSMFCYIYCYYECYIILVHMILISAILLNLFAEWHPNRMTSVTILRIKRIVYLLLYWVIQFLYYSAKCHSDKYHSARCRSAKCHSAKYHMQNDTQQYDLNGNTKNDYINVVLSASVFCNVSSAKCCSAEWHSANVVVPICDMPRQKLCVV